MFIMIACLVLWSPIKKELQKTAFYQFICCFQQQEGWTGDEVDVKVQVQSSNSIEQLPSYQVQGGLKSTSAYQN
jgi:hypothetical protein